MEDTYGGYLNATHTKAKYVCDSLDIIAKDARFAFSLTLTVGGLFAAVLSLLVSNALNVLVRFDISVIVFTFGFLLFNLVFSFTIYRKTRKNAQDIRKNLADSLQGRPSIPEKDVTTPISLEVYRRATLICYIILFLTVVLIIISLYSATFPGLSWLDLSDVAIITLSFFMLSSGTIRVLDTFSDEK